MGGRGALRPAGPGFNFVDGAPTKDPAHMFHIE